MNDIKCMFFTFEFIDKKYQYNIIDFFQELVNKDKRYLVNKSKELFLPQGDFELSPKGEEEKFDVICGKIAFTTKKTIYLKSYDKITKRIIEKKVDNEDLFAFSVDFAYRHDKKLFAFSKAKSNAIKKEDVINFLKKELEVYFGKNTVNFKFIRHIEQLEKVLSKKEIKEYVCNIQSYSNNPINIEKIPMLKKEFDDSKADKIQIKHYSKKYNLIMSKIIKESIEFIEHDYGKYSIRYKDEDENNIEKTLSSKTNLLEIPIKQKSGKIDIKDFIQKTNFIVTNNEL